MSAAAQAPAPTTAPDPSRAPTDMPSRIGRVLCLVRKLIDYGKNLASTVQQRAANPGFAVFAGPFGTADLTAILARITNGLRRATALEARLCQRAECGRDLKPSAAPLPRRIQAARRLPVSRTPARRPGAGPAPRASAHGSGDRRPGPPPPGRRRHRRHLPRPRHPARRLQSAVLGRTLPRHHRLRRQPRRLPRQAQQAAVRLRPQRRCGPRVAHGTAATSGARHRPALTKKFHQPSGSGGSWVRHSDGRHRARGAAPASQFG
jgi:hypothetical protein